MPYAVRVRSRRLGRRTLIGLQGEGGYGRYYGSSTVPHELGAAVPAAAAAAGAAAVVQPQRRVETVADWPRTEVYSRISYPRLP